MAAEPIRLDAAQARFEDLYREYAADVYRYALAIMRNPADAEDVVQATFMNAWRAYSAGEEPRAPLNWFISIAHNVCRLRFRTKSRRPREVEFEPALAESPAQEGPTARDVLDALAELPLNQRAALVMRELEGRSYGEIAGILGVSRSAVETLIFRARRSLRVKREAIQALALLPLPQSLASSVTARGAAEAGAAGLLGSGAVAKVVAVLAAAAVATGVGKEALRADARPDAAPTAPARVEPAAREIVAPVRSEPARVAVVRRQATPRPKAARPPAKKAPARVHGGRAAAIDGVPAAAPPPAPPASPAPALPEPPAVSPEPAPAAGKPAAPPPAPPAAPPRLVPLPAIEVPALPQVPAVPPLPPVSVPALPQPQLPAVPPVELPPVELPAVEVPPVEVAPLPAVPALP
jgi:RNA polymerase sigma factor (sigma-70 family)